MKKRKTEKRKPPDQPGRREKYIRSAAALLLLTALLLSSGCGSGTGGNGASSLRDTSTLVYGSGDYTRINPAMDEHCEINLLLFDGLTAHGKDNEVIPALAKSWDFDSSTCTYTFYLEEGVMWHDGEPFTAERRKIHRGSHHGSRKRYRETLPHFEDVEEISVSGDYTVSFRLPCPMRLSWTT